MLGTENRRGVSKEDAAQRNYFDIVGRHFWHICGVSFWFALSNLLFFGASIYLFSSYFGGDNLVTIVTAFLRGKSFIVPIVPFLPLMLHRPVYRRVHLCDSKLRKAGAHLYRVRLF